MAIDFNRTTNQISINDRDILQKMTEEIVRFCEILSVDNDKFNSISFLTVY